MAMTTEARRQLRLDKISRGICTYDGCHEKVIDGKRQCQKHLDRAAENARKLNTKSIAAGKCPRCKRRDPVEGRKYCTVCLSECNAATKANYRKDPSKQKTASARWRQAKIAAGICTQCNANDARPGHETCQDCAVEQSTKQRELHAERRHLVFKHYGEKCTCCGDNTIDLLQIDHIDGGGTKHLKKIGLGQLYKWLIDNNYPEGYQALCGSCNHGWGHLRYCPHAEGRLIEVSVDGKIRLQDPATRKFAKSEYPQPVVRRKKVRQKSRKASHEQHESLG